MKRRTFLKGLVLAFASAHISWLPESAVEDVSRCARTVLWVTEKDFDAFFDSLPSRLRFENVKLAENGVQNLLFKGNIVASTKMARLPNVLEAQLQARFQFETYMKHKGIQI